MYKDCWCIKDFYCDNMKLLFHKGRKYRFLIEKGQAAYNSFCHTIWVEYNPNGAQTEVGYRFIETNDFGNDHDYDLFGEYFVDSIRIVRKEKLKKIFNEVN